MRESLLFDRVKKLLAGAETSPNAARFDDILSGGNWVTGLAIGVGAVVVLPLAVPFLRPLAKTAIKGGILAYQR
jgi:hypothetical protein